MSIKKLGKEVQSRLSAAVKINSFKGAIEELVYNSLDSDSTSIAVRIDIHESFIQVIDNGFGISKSDIYLLGQRYATSKAGHITELKGNPSKYGFRGESLANIIEVSSHVKITSRHDKCDKTYVKYFYKGQHRDSYLTTKRPSKGTTVEIKGFLHNLHIQKRNTNAVIEIRSIKQFLEQMALERTNISMSFRDNSTNEIIFTVHKNRDVYQTLSSLFKIDKNDIQELQVEKNQYKIKGFVGKIAAMHNSHKWIYLNNRFVNKSGIHDIINEYFMKSKAKKKPQDNEINKKEIPYYFIFISCPQLDYDISFNPDKTIILFRDWTQITLLLEKFVKFCNGDIKLKEITVKQVKDKKLVGNTQEEARRIVEKILGDNVKFQMDKGVKGKTIRKKNKRKINNDNLHEKVYHGGSQKKSKTKENSIVQVIPAGQNINSCNEVHNNRKEIGDKFPHNNKNHEKLKEFKIKRNKSKPCSDPLIKKFINVTDSVQQRCDLYSENIKELLNKKIKSAREHIRHANIRGDEIRLHNNLKDIIQEKKRKYSVNHSDVKVTKEKCDKMSSVVPLVKANKEYLRSYDLVKTILNTQKNALPSIQDCVASPQSIDKGYKYTEQFNYSDNIIDVDNTRTNVASSLTKLTFNSHKYKNHNHYKSKIRQRQKSNNNLYNFSVRKEITQSVCKSKFKHRMFKKHLIEKDYEESRRQTMNQIPCSKMDNIKNIAQEKSYNVDISYNHKSNFMETLNKYSRDRWNFKVTENIHSTYTIKDSNVSINIEGFINHENTMNEFYEKSVHLEKGRNLKISSYLSEQVSMRNYNNELCPREIDNGCNSRNLFTSNSENLEPQLMSNSCIQPLTVCEAVYENHDDGSIQIDNIDKFNTTTKYNQSIFNNLSSILETNDEVDDDCMLRKNMDEISHHFQNANSFNLRSHTPQSQVNQTKINENVKNCQKQTEFNSKVEANNEKYNSESLDFYFETVPERTDIVNQNQTSTYFKIQDRHNFIPKGMSQIFEKCNSKKNCSYDVEMDYFQDELYNEFANNVLDNINLFETRIQNVKDNLPKNFNNFNKELKTKSASLKFNTLSLKNAKVFGQVDNKYIAAELHSENDDAIKYFVLFDQHAVHERITLEKNLSDYMKDDRWISADIEVLTIKLNKENVIYLNNYKDKFSQLGLKWMVENNLVLINGIPKAILGKHCRQPDVVLMCIKNLITEEIKAIRSLKGNSLLYPKSIMDFVFSEACRYAIKFGDVLTKDKCVMLIESLSTCKTPFQCAHGRPVMAVLMDMKTIDNEYTVDISKVLMFRNKVTK